MAAISSSARVPRIAIVGRPNVGKSTLFNRLVGRRKALVGNEPGITRDRLYGSAEWLGRRFEVVDTGGMIPGESELLASGIFRHAWKAIEESAAVVLVVDGREGLVPLDEELGDRLRRAGKPLALAVNKLDTPAHAALVGDFARLGIGDTFPISAEHGMGVDALLDWLVAQLGNAADKRESGNEAPARSGQDVLERSRPVSVEPSGLPPTIHLAIIGRPNVGKSTLLNRLVGEDRSLVTPIAGTTRDAVDAEVERDGRRFQFIDTAGIRRKGKTALRAEKLSVLQARRRLEQADVALVLLDATEGVTALDSHIAGYAHQSGRSAILVVNKWDVAVQGATAAEFTTAIRRRMKFLDYAPIVFLSALHGRRLDRLWQKIDEVAQARWKRIPTARMNAFLKTLRWDRVSSPRPLRLYYLTQAGVAPPTFVAFTHGEPRLYFSVERFLENQIRAGFDFPGTPLVIKCRSRRPTKSAD